MPPSRSHTGSGRARRERPRDAASRVRQLLWFAAFVVGIAVSGRLSELMLFPVGELVAFSGTAGIAAAATVLAPARWRPVYVATLFALTLLWRLAVETPLPGAVAFATANAVEVVVFAWLFGHADPRARWLTTGRSVLRFVAAAFVAALAGALVVAAGLEMSDVTPYPAWQSFLVRAGADVTGILAIGPVIILAPRLQRMGWRAAAEMTCFALLLVVAIWMDFLGAIDTPYVLPYLPLAVLLLAVARLGMPAAAVLPVLLVPLSVWFTAQGQGAFTGRESVINAVSTVQFYNAVAVTAAWLVAAVVTEREAARRSLRRRIARRTAALRKSRQRLRDQLLRTEVLAEFSRTAPLTGRRPQDVLTEAARGVVAALGGACMMLVPNEPAGRFRVIAGHDSRPEAEPAAHALLEEAPPRLVGGPAGEALRRGRSIILAGAGLTAALEQMPPAWGEHVARFDIDGISVVPLRHGNRPIGVVGLVHYRGDPAYGDADIAFVEEVAVRASLVLENIRLTGEAEASAAAIAASEERFRLAFDQAPVAAGMVSLAAADAGRFLRVNQALADLTGRTGPELLQQTLPALAAPDQREICEALIARLASGAISQSQVESEWLVAGGQRMTVEISASAVTEQSEAPYLIAHVEDITNRRRAEQELARRALYDPLTELPNRHVCMDHLRMALDRLPREGGMVALLYTDVDRFKDINDTLGHQAGDLALQSVGRWLGRIVRAPDTAGRIGGDEFVVIAHVSGRPAAEAIADRIQELLQRSEVMFDGASLKVSASIGIALTEVPVPPQDLLRRADTAMYSAKSSGGNRWEVYTDALSSRTNRRLELVATLRTALAEDRFELQYQPIVDLGTGRIVAVEALPRLHDEARGMLLPEDFIEIAEESELAVPIAEWVLVQACDELARWQEAGLRTRLAMNVSGTDAGVSAVTEQLLTRAQQAGAEPSRLILEMTEQAFLGARAETSATLRILTQRGVGLAIDNFRSGLTHVRHFPVTALKIGPGFVAGLPSDPYDRAAVAAVVVLADALGLTVIADGVENAGQAEALVQLRCDQGQGVHFGRPAPADMITHVLLADAERAPR